MAFAIVQTSSNCQKSSRAGLSERGRPCDQLLTNDIGHVLDLNTVVVSSSVAQRESLTVTSACNLGASLVDPFLTHVVIVKVGAPSTSSHMHSIPFRRSARKKTVEIWRVFYAPPRRKKKKENTSLRLQAVRFLLTLCHHLQGTSTQLHACEWAGNGSGNGSGTKDFGYHSDSRILTLWRLEFSPNEQDPEPTTAECQPFPDLSRSTIPIAAVASDLIAASQSSSELVAVPYLLNVCEESTHLFSYN